MPGPIKPGGFETIELTYDVSSLRGGRSSLRWNNIEVYGKSQNSEDTNLANNKGKEGFD